VQHKVPRPPSTGASAPSTQRWERKRRKGRDGRKYEEGVKGKGEFTQFALP